jgi:3-methyladenine DNA glycosylase Mpg
MATSDLVPQNITLGSTSMAPGALLSVSWLLANQGTAAANSTSTTELRINQSTTSFAGTDLAGVSTAALAGLSSVSQNAALTAPTTPGTYYVWVIADNFSKVSNQSSITNDEAHSVAFTVAVASSTDTILDTVNTTGTLSSTATGAIDATPMSGSANTSFDHDWYKVTLTAGHSYTFSANGTSGTLNDVAIDLRNSSGTLVNSVVDGGANGTASFSYTPAASTFYFLAVSAGGANATSLTGNYSLSLQDNGVPSTDTILDTVNTTGTLSSAATGAIDATPMSGSANTSFDHDWYKVTLTAGHSYTFSANGTSGTLNDVAIDLRNSSGTLVNSVVDGGANGTASFSYTPAASTFYFLAVSAGGANATSLTGNYSLSLQDNGVPSTDTILDTVNTTGTLSSTATGAIDATPMSGSANTSFDHDWYKVTLTAGHSYTFSANGTSGTLNDVAIDLRNSSGTLVNSVVDGGANGTASFSYTPNASTFYFLAVSAGGANATSLTGNYSLALQDNGVPSTDTILDTVNTTGTLSSTATGAIDATPMSGSANTSFDHDWYKVTLTAGHSYTFSANGTSGSLNDVAIDLRNSSGTLLNTVADGGTNGTASFSYTPAASTFYFLAVSAGGPNATSLTGNYSLSLHDNGVPSTDTILDTVNTTGALSTTATGAIDATPMSGSANTSFDHDWYKVTLTAGHSYTFSANGTSGSLNDVAIDLRNSSGILLNTVADGGANGTASFSYTPAASTFYFLAVSAGGANATSLTGNYSLSLQDHGVPSTIDNILDNANTSQVLSTTATGTIDPEPMSGSTTNVSDGAGGLVDKDWFKVTLSKGNLYTFSGTATSITTGLMDINLYGQNGTSVISNAVEGAAPSFTFDTTYQTNATQTYYLAVSAGGANPAWKTATGNYSVSLSGQATTAAPDHIPGSIQGAFQLPENTTHLDTIDSSDVSGGADDDYYQVTLKGGSNYVFTASAGVSDTDTLDSIFIRLRDSSGNVLSTSSTSDAGPSPSFHFTAPGSGVQTYYLAISASSVGSSNGVPTDQKTGAYSISFVDPAPSGGSTSTSGNGETLNPSGPGPVAGFDTHSYPGAQIMDWLSPKEHNYNFQWTGFYLYPAPSRNQPLNGGDSWMGQGVLADLVNHDWKVAPIYVGEQDPNHPDQPIDSYNPGAVYNSPKFGLISKGTADSNSDEVNSAGIPNSAVQLLDSAGFSKGSTVYLDIETEGSSERVSTVELNYIKDWFAGVAAGGYTPGIYCLTGDYTTIYNAISNLYPTTPFWIRHDENLSPTAPNYPTNDPAGSGVQDATAWQYDIGTSISTPFGVVSPVDLDTIKVSPSATLSVDSPQAAPVSVNGGLVAVQGSGSSAGTNVAVGADGTIGVVSDGITGDIKAVFNGAKQFLFDGGLYNDIVKILHLISEGISNDTVFFNGNDGNDTLDGTGADTTIVASGGSGNDTLIGGPLADVFNGGLGADTLTAHHGADTFIFDSSALTDAQAATPVLDRVTDLGQGDSGSFQAAEGDQIDLSALLSTAYSLGGGQPVSSLVRAIASGGGTDLQIDPDGAANGTNWVTVAHLDGIHHGESLNVILDASQPAGAAIVVAGAASNGSLGDILWQNDNGSVAIWNNGQAAGGHVVANPGSVQSSWHIAGSGDFDGNSHSDLLWQNDNGSVAIWDDSQAAGGRLIAGAGSVPGAWHIATTGDFDGNGHTDILWQNDNGAVAIWDNGQAAGGHLVANAGSVPSSWHIAATGDFDGNHHADILWQNDNGSLAIWDNGQAAGGHVVAAPGSVQSSWHIAATGDFDGNGHADILWQNDNGAVAIWDNGQAAGGHIVANAGQVPGSWHIAASGDFDRNGHTDILWQNDNGGAAIWDNGQPAGGHVVANAGGVASDWHFV